MTSTCILAEIVDEAMKPGVALEPANLLQALERFDDAVIALFNHDIAQELFSIFSSEFGYFPLRSLGTPSLDGTALSRWSGLFRWLVDAINTWEPEGDPKSCRLAAIIFVSQALDAEGILWDLMPTTCVLPQAMIARLKALVRSFSISFTPRTANIPEPISERETIDKFAIDDAQGNWAAIAKAIPQFEGSLFLVSLILTQSVRCLYRRGLETLVDAVTGIRQTLVSLQIASVLSDDERLRVAASSTNPYIEFGCVFQTLSRREPAAQLSTEDQKILSDILLKVAHDEARWASWMSAFNTFPNRSPVLQTPLGAALAVAPDYALGAYIDALQLTAQPVGRDLGRSQVASCLRAFRDAATPERRGLLWKLAHTRWLAWDFDKDNAHTHLIAVNRSHLDYAIVGFACEVLTEAERAAAISAIRKDLNNLDLQWFDSSSEINDAWNRLLSRLQPYAYASQIAQSDGDWLAEKYVVLPFDPSTDAYAAMKYTLMNLSTSQGPSSAPY